MEARFNNVLVPFDYSGLSNNALRTAIAMCHRHQAHLHLLNVSESEYMVPAASIQAPVIAFPANTEKETSERIERLAAEIKKHQQIECTGYSRTGFVADAICQTAQETNADIIVIGTHGASGIREFFLGSNAYRVVKYAPCPVLTIPEGRKTKYFKRILFPIRPVPQALDKYDHIKSIISKNDASLVIISISENRQQADSDIVTSMTDELKRRLDFTDTYYENEFHYSNDIPGKILELSRGKNVDLIVITASLDKTFRQFFVGPYAQQIVNHSTVAVLSIKSDTGEVDNQTGILGNDMLDEIVLG